MSTALDQRLRGKLHALDRAGLTRRLPAISHRQSVAYRVDGRPCIGFCSNDYLDLARTTAPPKDPSVPSGAGASRLICGDLPQHRRIEHRLASLVQADDAVLFPTGYQLNVGVLPALLDPPDRACSDALCHASLIDGLRLARAHPLILPHAQPPSLEPSPGDSLTWWILESIFSMDGDAIDPDLLRSHLDHGGCLYLDEAHALGLFPEGTGYATHHGIQPTALVGTLGKALGCAGAFVAGSHTLCDWIRARARSFVFTTGVSPALVARLDAAIDILTGADGASRRARLWSNVRRFAEHLDIKSPPSPIFPLLVGDNDLVLTIAEALLIRGWHVQPIRPPTVPKGTARLRITVTAAHSEDQIDTFARDLMAAFASHDRPIVLDRGRTQPLPPHAAPTLASASQ